MGRPALKGSAGRGGGRGGRSFVGPTPAVVFGPGLGRQSIAGGTRGFHSAGGRGWGVGEGSEGAL